MDISYYGANCLKISAKKANIIVDDNLAEVGLKSVTKPDDIVLVTSPNIKVNTGGRLKIDQPGEYEVSDISIQGVGARGALDEAKTFKSTIYKITCSDINLVVLGHVFEDITDDEIEDLGHVDVLVIPVGGNGYTLDGMGALKIIKKIEPKIVIPTHFADKEIKYEVTQTSLGDALKGLAMEPTEPVAKLKLKPIDIPDTLHLAILERQ